MDNKTGIHEPTVMTKLVRIPYSAHESVSLQQGHDFRKTNGRTHEFWVDRANCAVKRMKGSK